MRIYVERLASSGSRYPLCQCELCQRNRLSVIVAVVQILMNHRAMLVQAAVRLVSSGYWIMGVLVMVVMNVRVFVSLGFGTVPMIN
jgi:hypothetical protein